MGFREFIGEPPKVIEEASGQTAAFFISPRGELISTNGRKHISLITQFPNKFGLTNEYIEDKYKEYSEKVGIEGKARQDIIILLIEQGWVRIRRYPKKSWVIDVHKLDKRMKDRIYDFSNKILEGTGGYKEQDKYMSVKVIDMQGYKSEFSISELSSDVLFNEEVIDNTRSRYILVVKDIMDIKDRI